MDAVSSDETNQGVQPGEGDGNGAGTVKRLLEGEGTTLPEPKRAKVDETPEVDPDNRSYVSGPSGVSKTTQKFQKGKQNEKNKGRRRGTRPQLEDHPDRPKTPRLPKRQCAILIGFSGTNYAGMQM